jgi:hypothetical protein
MIKFCEKRLRAAAGLTNQQGFNSIVEFCKKSAK